MATNDTLYGGRTTEQWAEYERTLRNMQLRDLKVRIAAILQAGRHCGLDYYERLSVADRILSEIH